MSFTTFKFFNDFGCEESSCEEFPQSNRKYLSYSHDVRGEFSQQIHIGQVFCGVSFDRFQRLMTIRFGSLIRATLYFYCFPIGKMDHSKLSGLQHLFNLSPLNLCVKNPISFVFCFILRKVRQCLKQKPCTSHLD